MKYWLTDQTDRVFTIECNRVRVRPNGAVEFYKNMFSINPFLVVNAVEWKMIEQAKTDTDAKD